MANSKTTKTCFVVSPIGDAGSKIRDRADKVLKHIIKKSLEPHGYKVLRVDEILEPGIITSDIIQHLLNSELVIADLTGNNPNVFYELAVRHATGKPLIQISAEGEKLPFDVANVRTIFFNYQDLDSVEECCNSIDAQIKSIENSRITFENPISNAVNLSELQRSNEPVENTLAQILVSIERLKYDIDDLRFYQLTSPSRYSSTNKKLGYKDLIRLLSDLGISGDLAHTIVSINKSQGLTEEALIELLKEPAFSNLLSEKTLEKIKFYL